jgi:hypothetical protein
LDLFVLKAPIATLDAQTDLEPRALLSQQEALAAGQSCALFLRTVAVAFFPLLYPLPQTQTTSSSSLAYKPSHLKSLDLLSRVSKLNGWAIVAPSSSLEAPFLAFTVGCCCFIHLTMADLCVLMSFLMHRTFATPAMMRESVLVQFSATRPTQEQLGPASMMLYFA